MKKEDIFFCVRRSSLVSHKGMVYLQYVLSSHIFKETQRNRKGDSKKKSRIQQHSMFTFCALCSDDQMCLEIQNTKLCKSKKQTTDHESLNIWADSSSKITAAWRFCPN